MNYPEKENTANNQFFSPWDGKDLVNLCLLIKIKGYCFSSQISSESWDIFQENPEKVSENLLKGAVNAFNDKTDSVLDPSNGEYVPVSVLAKKFRKIGKGSVVVAEEHFGEGPSIRQAPMEARIMNVRAVLAKSFASTHETDLRKQGILTLTFKRKHDYDKIREDDHISIFGLECLSPEEPLTVKLGHRDGTSEHFEVSHSYNQEQIEGFKAKEGTNIQ
jgi:Aconitase A